MTKELERTLSEDDLRLLQQTLVLKRESTVEGTPDLRPKVRYIATDGTSVVRIMGAAVFAMNHKGLSESAAELRKRILGWDYEQPADALDLMGDYVGMKIVDEEGKEIGSIGWTVGAEIMADKILVVDDERATRKLLHAFLTSQGYEVILAPSGVEGFDLARAESPDAILLDWKMPGIDGLTVCRRLRAEEKTRYIPVIMITGFGTTKEEATEAGADDLISKPFNLTELAVRIKSVLCVGHITDRAERLIAYMDGLDKNRQK